MEYLERTNIEWDSRTKKMKILPRPLFPFLLGKTHQEGNLTALLRTYTVRPVQDPVCARMGAWAASAPRARLKGYPDAEA